MSDTMPEPRHDARPSHRSTASGVAPTGATAAPVGPVPAGRVEHARTDDARAGDHAAIDRLVSELLPAWIARLAASGRGAIEVREDSWTVRLRRPAGGATGPADGRRSTDRPSRQQPGHEGHGHGPTALERHRSARSAAAGTHSSNGSGAPAAMAVGPRPVAAGGPADRRGRTDPHRAVATSPAVGVFHARGDVRRGARVRSGDPIGAIDMLGIPQEVVAPADGVVADILVEPGETVEYGQDLVAIELMTQTGAAGGTA